MGSPGMKFLSVRGATVVCAMSVAPLFGGCTKEPDAAQKSDTVSRPTSGLQQLSSTQDTPRSPASRDVKQLPASLVIDVGPLAEISGVVRALFQDSRGTLWFGGECELFRNDGSTLTSFDIKDDRGRGVTIMKVVEDKAGNIWCGTSGGITRIDGKAFTSYGEKDGLLSGEVWSMAVDASGVIWIGTIEGVCRFDGKTFSPFALPEARPDPTRGVTSGKIVHCITVDRNGRVWFGTNGGAYVYDGKTLTNYSERDGLPNNAVSSILQDKAGNIWFGTIHGGISLFDEKGFTNFTKQGTVEGKEIWCIHEGPSGNVWFSGKNSPLYRFDGNTFTKLNEQVGITSLAFNILEDSSGRLWLSGTHGLFRHDGASFVRVTKDGPWHECPCR
jgi:ligand-binding sensor domain-containing protein